MANRVNIGAARIPDVAKLPLVALPTVGLRGVAGGGTGGYWPAGTPEAIRQSCMLWYDVARQGCTNEAMAADPVLRDLSGNGHDAACHNFAWAGMSGVGGYALDFTGKFLVHDSRADLERSAYVFTVKSIKGSGSFLETNSASQSLPSFAIKVRGLDAAGVTLRYGSDITSFYDMAKDGEYQLPGVDSSPFIGFRFDKAVGQCDVTVEMMPLYPGALVSDGVNDYCLVEGLPLLTKERGFTVVCRRVILWDDVRSMGVMSKSTNALHADGICFEVRDSVNKFCQSLQGSIIVEEFEPQEVSWLTSQSYNGNPIRGSANRIDTDFLSLFTFNKSGGYGKVALYSFLLFNRDLTTEEIEWVKTNMMQQ